MFITPSFKKSLIVEQFQGNYLKIGHVVRANRDVKHDVGKNETFASVFSSLHGRIKIFVFAVNSKRHFSISVWFIKVLQEKNVKSKVIIAVCRKRHA